MRTKDAQILNQIGKTINTNEYIDKSLNLYKIILNKFKCYTSKDRITKKL